MLREFTRHLPADELAHMRLAMAAFDGTHGEQLALASEEPNGVPAQVASAKQRKVRVVSPESSETLAYWEAGKYAGLPQSVLRYLRQTGLLPVRHATRYMATFTRVDVEALLARLSAIPVVHSDGESISLRDAMRLKLFHADGKGELVAAVLEQKVRVRSQSSGVDLMLDRADVDRFCAEARRRTFGGAITPTEGAAALYCSNAAVVGLFEAGHIAGQRIGVRNVRLEPGSVARFSELYRSLASVAAELDTSVNRLISLADGERVNILAVPAAKGRLQGFVARCDIDQLSDLARRARPAGGRL